MKGNYLKVVDRGAYFRPREGLHTMYEKVGDARLAYGYTPRILASLRVFPISAVKVTFRTKTLLFLFLGSIPACLSSPIY